MPINPAIALNVKPVEIANPLAMYSQVAQIQNYQQQNALNQMKMEEAQRTLASQNALNQAYSQAYDPATGELNTNQLMRFLATGGYGAQIPGVQKGIREAETASVKLQTEKQGLIKSKLEGVKPLYQQALSSANPGAAMLEIHSAVHADPILGPWLKSMGVTADRGQQDIMAAITQGPEAVKQKLLGSIASVDKLLPTLTSTETGGGVQLGTRDPITGEYIPGAVVSKTPLPADVEAQRERLAKAGAAQQKVVLPAQETEWEKAVGKGQADKLFASQTAAEDAASILTTNNEARALLDKGMITGAGAEFLVSLNQGLKQLGMDFGYAEASANAQAYGAVLGNNVGRMIKQFGAGTGLSDADREYAAKIAAGTIKMDEKALRKILDINDKMARNVINAHNKKYKGVKTNIPVTVEMPAAASTVSTAPSGVPQDVWNAMTPQERALWQK
jgi:hypothetical protein